MKLDEALELLGLEQECTEEEAKKSYRSGALRHHPDKNPDNVEEATATFKRIGARLATSNARGGTPPPTPTTRGPPQPNSCTHARARAFVPPRPTATRRAQARHLRASESSTRRG